MFDPFSVDQLGSSDVLSLRTGIVVGRDDISFNSIEQVMEDAARKREIRLLKNKLIVLILSLIAL